MAEVKVRKATHADLTAVSSLLTQTWRDTYPDIYSAEQISDLTRRWHNIDVLAGQQADPGMVFLVAELDGSISGHALARLHADAIVWLVRLYVLPAAQGHGLGKKLYKQVLAMHPKAKSVRLEVEPQNTRAVRFYQSLGFVESGQTSNCGGDSNVPAMIMEKVLKK
jgi:ribosomal protein S18 acetylase RimI-like enzyme